MCMPTPTGRDIVGHHIIVTSQHEDGRVFYTSGVIAWSDSRGVGVTLQGPVDNGPYGWVAFGWEEVVCLGKTTREMYTPEDALSKES